MTDVHFNDIRHGSFLHKHHFRGELEDGSKFTFCPMGLIVSWSSADYDNHWCEYCKTFYKPLFKESD